MNFIDSHCHIDGKEFDADRSEIIERARESGVKAMLVIGTGEPESGNFERAVNLAASENDIYAAIGVHPHDAKTFDDEAEARLVNLAKSSEKVIAWGEIGLDYYYDHSPRDVQTEVFKRQIRIARELDLPIIIHSRDANDETVEILREECAGENFRGGIMHCFGGTPEMARDLMEIGFMISFAGNVTFKKAENLRDSAKVVPMERLLIETDCPYLAPIPMRGKRNEPSFVVHTAQFLADFYGVSIEELAGKTTNNFLNFFRLAKSLSLVIFILAFLALHSNFTFAQTRKANEIKQINTYCKTIDAFIKRHKKPQLIFADISDYNDDSKTKWRKFASEKALEKAETYSIAYNWRRNGKIIHSNFTLFSPSGDWVEYVYHYFREDGTLAKAEQEMRTFNGDLIVIQDFYFDRKGKLLKKSIKYLDLRTHKPIKPTKEFLANNEDFTKYKDYYKKTSKLPFAKLLK